MLEAVGNNSDQITIVIAILAGLFAFIKWIDTRNQTLKNERYERYIQHIRILSGSKANEGASICITEQIAAAWLLLEYSEYFDISLKILDNPDLTKMSNKPWQDFVLPQIKQVIEEIKSRT